MTYVVIYLNIKQITNLQYYFCSDISYLSTLIIKNIMANQDIRGDTPQVTNEKTNDILLVMDKKELSVSAVADSSSQFTSFSSKGVIISVVFIFLLIFSELNYATFRLFFFSCLSSFFCPSPCFSATTFRCEASFLRSGFSL